MDIPSPSVQTDRSRRSQLGLASRRGQSTLSLADLTSAIPQTAIKKLDRLLRRLLGIHEFSREPDCILRYSRARSELSLTPPNGEKVKPGDPTLELHFWNERIDRRHHPNSSLSSLRFSLHRSQALLAAPVKPVSYRYQSCSRDTCASSQRSCRIHQLFGCTLYIAPRSSKWNVHDFFEDFLIHCLRWAFNPRRSRQRSFHLNRIEIWISAADLKSRFAQWARRTWSWL
jgi:hypothetical protein